MGVWKIRYREGIGQGGRGGAKAVIEKTHGHGAVINGTDGSRVECLIRCSGNWVCIGRQYGVIQTGA